MAPDVLYALWTPGAASARAELAAEATAIADEADDPHLAFVVHHVSYGAAVCVGDASRATRYLGRLHDIADQIGEPLMRWHVGILDTFVATMAARFGEAERIANATLELGMQIGDPDAFGVFAGQFFFFGTFAGRHAELLPIVQQMMDTDPHVEPLFRAGHALVCCEVGQPEVGRAVLRDAMAAGLDAISQDSLGSTTLIAHAVLAIELDDVTAAEWLFPAIAPMAGEVSFNGVTSQGPVSAYVGKLASLLGRYDDAERHLLDALATTEAFGWEYHRATTLIALAQNRVRATGMLDAEGEGWLSNAEELCRDVRHSPAGSSAPPSCGTSSRCGDTLVTRAGRHDAAMADELPPYAALLTHRVDDVDRWKAGFDDHEPARRAAGILGHHINRAQDDPHVITLFLALSDLDRAKAFTSSLDLGEVMQNVGVVSRPEIQWLRPIREAVVSHRQLPAFLIRHRVADFDTWLAGYDAAGDAASVRRDHRPRGEPLARRSVLDHRLPPGRDLRRIAQLPRRPAGSRPGCRKLA